MLYVKPDRLGALDERPDVYERFLTKVEFSSDCWLWTAATNPQGYGYFCLDNVMQLAHRVAWRLMVGAIPTNEEAGFDVTLDHLCRVRNCVRPAHLEICSRTENVMRGETLTAAFAAQTHCKHGHEFTEENTWRRRRVREDGKVHYSRCCRTCNRATARRLRAEGKKQAH